MYELFLVSILMGYEHRHILEEPRIRSTQPSGEAGYRSGLVAWRGEVPGEATTGKADGCLGVDAGRGADGGDEWTASRTRQLTVR